MFKSPAKLIYTTVTFSIPPHIESYEKGPVNSFVIKGNFIIKLTTKKINRYLSNINLCICDEYSQV